MDDDTSALGANLSNKIVALENDLIPLPYYLFQVCGLPPPQPPTVCFWTTCLVLGVLRSLWRSAAAMADSSLYGSTRELMTAAESEAGGCATKKRRSVLSRQRSSLSFDDGAKKIDQVRFFWPWINSQFAAISCAKSFVGVRWLIGGPMKLR